MRSPHAKESEDDGIREYDWTGNARSAQDAHEDVLRLPAEDRLRAEHERLPRLPGLPRRAARHEQGGREAHRDERPHARRGDQQARDLRPKELLLPRHGEGLPDLRERKSPLHRRRRGDHEGGRHEEARPHQPHPPRRGRREDQPLRHDLRRRLQPGRHAAHGDRRRARPRGRRRGDRLPDGPQGDSRLRGRLRLQPRRGQHALRRQHLDPPRRLPDARNQGRDQEHELLQRHPRRARIRGAPPARLRRAGRPHRAGDAPLGPRGAGDGFHADEGERA